MPRAGSRRFRNSLLWSVALIFVAPVPGRAADCDRQAMLSFHTEVDMTSGQRQQRQTLEQQGLLLTRELTPAGYDGTLRGWQWLDLRIVDGEGNGLPVEGLARPFATATDGQGVIRQSWHIGDDIPEARRMREGIVRALRIAPQARHAPIERLEQTDLGQARVRYEPVDGGVHRVVLEYTRPRPGLRIELSMDEAVLRLDACGVASARGIVDVTVSDQELGITQRIVQRMEYGPVEPVQPQVRQRALLYRLPDDPADWAEWSDRLRRQQPVNLEKVRDDLLKLADSSPNVAAVRSWLLRHSGQIETALPELLRSLDLDDGFRARLMSELGSLETREALRTLQVLLTDQRQQVDDRVRAAAALGFRGDAGQTQFGALWSLWLPSDPQGRVPTDAQERWRLRRRQGEALATTALLATGTMVRTLDGASPAVAAQVNAQLRTAMSATTDPDELRYLAMALGNTGLSGNADLLWPLVDPGRPEALAREAIDALVRLGSLSDVQRLVAMADRLGDEAVLLIAERLLASDVVLDERSVQTLAARAAATRAASVRLSVARALARQAQLGQLAAAEALGMMRASAVSRDELRVILNARRDAGLVTR